MITILEGEEKVHLRRKWDKEFLDNDYELKEKDYIREQKIKLSHRQLNGKHYSDYISSIINRERNILQHINRKTICISQLPLLFDLHQFIALFQKCGIIKHNTVIPDIQGIL